MAEKINKEGGEKNSILKVSFVNYRESWYRLPPEERNEIFDSIREKWEELGMKSLGLGKCYWSCEKWMLFSFEQYPDIETLQEFERWLSEETRWTRHTDTWICLGTAMDAEEFVKMQIIP